MVIISSYSILCYLLRCYLNLLKEKLLIHSIEPLEWMREICEFRKHLHHLNCRIAIPVSLFTLLNLSYCFSSIIHLFRDMNTCPVKIFSMSLGNIILFMFISLVPFFQVSPYSFLKAYFVITIHYRLPHWLLLVDPRRAVDIWLVYGPSYIEILLPRNSIQSFYMLHR